MDVFRSNTPEFDARGLDATGQNGNEVVQVPDPRLQPTPDYGKLGPGSDFSRYHAGYSIAPPVDRSNSRLQSHGNLRVVHLLAALGGIVALVVASGRGNQIRDWEKISAKFAPQGHSISSSPLSKRDLDRQRPQQQAEILLTRAVSHSSGATDEIQSHIEGWRGKLELNPQLSQLTTAALNSADQNVRVSAIEVQLAAYGLNKSDSTVDALVRQADTTNHAQKIWALWALGLIGNRGIETDRVVQVLTAHLQGPGRDSDEDSRHWAVEGLALAGTNSTIAPLLDAMHDDSSALVRERAACSLAESGMLTHEQRLTAVPQLIDFSDDPTLDSQTHAWALQALADITKQRLPHDSVAWRVWYQQGVANGQ